MQRGVYQQASERNTFECGKAGMKGTRCGTRGKTLTGMRADVPLQVKGVIETLAAITARVPLDVAVAFDVALQHALLLEALAAHLTDERRRPGWRWSRGGRGGRGGRRSLCDGQLARGHLFKGGKETQSEIGRRQKCFSW